MSDPATAAHRVRINPDILSDLATHLPRPTLVTCLRTTTNFHFAVPPRLYHTIEVRRDLNPFAFTSRSGNPIYGKKAVLKYINVVNIYEHEVDACTGLDWGIDQPELEVLHLAGGGRPKGLDNPLCQTDTCLFVSVVSSRAKRVI